MNQHAKASFEEFETIAYIKNLLRDVPCLTIDKPSPTGLVTTLHGGHPGNGKNWLMNDIAFEIR